MSLRAAVLAMVLVASGSGGVPADAQAPLGKPPPCIEKAPCVYVSPDPEVAREAGTEYLYQGQGWRPRRRVLVVYHAFCPPGALCDNTLRRRRIAVDANGRFRLRLHYGRGRAGASLGRKRFEQRRGRRGRVVRNALPLPPPSTAAERAEAAALVAATRRARRALDGRSDELERVVRRYARRVSSCRALDVAEDRERTAVVGDALIIVEHDQLVVGTRRAQLDAFAAELERAPVSDPALRAGVDAWIAAIRRERSYPPGGACAAMERWEATGYADDRRPLDPYAAPRQTFEREIATSDALRAARRRMRALGAGRRDAERFGGELVDVSDG